jgi:hypothetical protein
MKRIILCSVMLLLSANALLAKDPKWLRKMKQVKLLSDTYEDVIKIMGKPAGGSSEREHIEYFDFKEGRMTILYSLGVCKQRGVKGLQAMSGWKIPEFTVVKVSFSPDKHISPKKSFIKLNGFTKKPVKYADDYSDGATPDDHRRAPFQFEYDNNELGIQYFEEYGKISEFTFFPSEQFDYLRCDK